MRQIGQIGQMRQMRQMRHDLVFGHTVLYCLIKSPCQDALASGTFLSAIAEALMMKSFMLSLPSAREAFSLARRAVTVSTRQVVDK